MSRIKIDNMSHSLDTFLVEAISSLISTSSKEAIFANVIKSGCVELEHQRLIVVTLTPNCSANYRPVLSFSTRTILIRFKPLIAYLFKFAAKLLTYIVIRKNITC